MSRKILCGVLLVGLLAPLAAVALGADGDKPAAEAISFKKLKAAMPDKLGGLDRYKLEGQSTTAGEISISTATGRYAKDKDGNEPTIEVTVVDYSNPDMVKGMAAWASLNLNSETDDEYTKTIKIDGNPAMEQFNTKNTSGSYTVVIAGRFLFTAQTHGVKEDDFKKLKDQLPLKAFADLAK